MTDTLLTVLVGSLRADSLNRRLALAMRERAPRGVRVDVVEDLGSLPFYNEDLEAGALPAEVVALRERVGAADAVLAVTPEYNGTMPAALSNAIDWLSRPYGAGALVGTPFAVVGTTPTPYGGRWAHADALRSARIAGAVPVEEATVSQTGIDVDVLTDPDVLATLDRAVSLLLESSQARAA